jgi:hypothetical protein
MKESYFRGLIFYERMTETIIPYILKIPDIITGMIDFIIRSGFKKTHRANSYT